jgi:sirohydrochlorin cobaltochelatase
LKLAMDQAVILFAHGARDARWAVPLSELAEAVRVQDPRASVRTAFLELQAPTLMEALEAAASDGVRRVHVVPVFWAAAGHVDNQMPSIVAEFGRRYPHVAVRVLPVLSELPGMLDFIARTVADSVAHAEPTR